MPSASHQRSALPRNGNVLIAGSTAMHRLNDPFIEMVLDTPFRAGDDLKTCRCVENNPRLRYVADHVQGAADSAAESIQRVNDDRVAIAGKPQHPCQPWASTVRPEFLTE